MLEQVHFTLSSAKNLYGNRNTLSTTTLSPEQAGENQPRTEKVSLGMETVDAATYTKSLIIGSGDVQPLEKLQKIVADIFKEQGVSAKVALDGREIDITELTPEEAQDLIAEDGYFGVEKTAERIFQFAVGIADGDRGRIDAIREGIDRGFQEALDAFGGQLPDISYDTYDAVMKKLDDWLSQDDQSNV